MFFENFGSKGKMLLIVQGEDFYFFFFFFQVRSLEHVGIQRRRNSQSRNVQKIEEIISELDSSRGV